MQSYYTNHYDSPIGEITLASNGSELTGLWFDGQKYFADTLPEQYEEKDLPIFDQTKRWLDIYFSGKPPILRRLSLWTEYRRFVSVCGK